MQITEVRIKLIEEVGDRLQAFCSLTFDNSFVVRDLKIIEGSSGPFVAMPSRKLTARCGTCGCKNYLRAAFCNQCGTRLSEERALRDDAGRPKLYADIAHPINAACREMIQHRVVQEFHNELERAKQPGYVSRYDDFDLEDDYAIGGVNPLTIPQETPHTKLHTKVQPPEMPRGPHKARSLGRATPPRGDREFGAGIL